MKCKFMVVFTILFLFFMYSCASNQSSKDRQQTTQTARLSTAPVYWTGDGGRGIRIAVLEPTVNGLAVSERWILSMIQSSITGDFQTFSAMTIVDCIFRSQNTACP